MGTEGSEEVGEEGSLGGHFGGRSFVFVLLGLKGLRESLTDDGGYCGVYECSYEAFGCVGFGCPRVENGRMEGSARYPAFTRARGGRCLLSFYERPVWLILVLRTLEAGSLVCPLYLCISSSSSFCAGLLFGFPDKWLSLACDISLACMMSSPSPSVPLPF